MAKDYSQFSKEELLKIVEKLESRKKYGLIWDEEKVKEQFEKDAENALPVLKEISSKEITDKDPSKPVNILIEGDNYHALSVLNFTHQGKIDVIYIDPPYNTGNRDFKYNDNYIDREDSYRHSKWISFMTKRLKLAKNLLKETGMIFISIDDNESAQLKLICDEVFGEDNFRNSIVVSRVKKNIQEREYARSLNLGHGLVLFYAMAKAEIIIPTKFQQKEERWHAFDAPGIRKTMEYKIFGHKPPQGRHWMLGEKKAIELIDKGLLRPSPTGKPQYKLEASDITRLDTNWSDLQEGDSKWKFENGEKNIALMKRLIGMYPSKDCLVLDFFAGSGTTGHAVLEFNKEDTGTRTFILCTNNELNGFEKELEGKELSEKEIQEYGICRRVTYPRIEKVIKGYKNSKDKKIDGLGGSLKYFKTKFVKKNTNGDDFKTRITHECTEMLCLREGVFDEVKKSDQYRIFQQGDKTLAVYYSLDRKSLPALKKELEKMDGEKILYCFTLDQGGLNEKEFKNWKDVKLEPIPQKILEVYNENFRSIQSNL
ncbi:MAG: hypothetical protein A2235_04665 [Deltaproteobacteria bacterium RIFOXYA2_FULL_42_10]|nr:MAG: hypothetical protein A2235_04665 [Deltaproteobacteria bacterium RIFOXYA2_FULL_42_10]